MTTFTHEFSSPTVSLSLEYEPYLSPDEFDRLFEVGRRYFEGDDREPPNQPFTTRRLFGILKEYSTSEAEELARHMLQEGLSATPTEEAEYQDYVLAREVARKEVGEKAVVLSICGLPPTEKEVMSDNQDLQIAANGWTQKMLADNGDDPYQGYMPRNNTF